MQAMLELSQILKFVFRAILSDFADISAKGGDKRIREMDRQY